MIPGSGRSAGEGIGYPLQYSQASLVAQLVKNTPAIQETWVRSLGWEDPLEKGKGTCSSISGLENSMDCTERLSLSLSKYIQISPFSQSIVPILFLLSSAKLFFLEEK